MHRLYATLILGLMLSLASAAHAQMSDKKLADANRVAMDAYNNLDIESAKKALEDAVKAAERANTHGSALARTYANLGVVLVGGLGDTPGGTDAFMHALKEDPNVEPDPIVSTPEVMTAFNTAKRKVASGGGAKPIAAVAAAAPPIAAATQGPIEGNLAHTPPPEQLSQTAVPVYVAKGGVEAETLKIFYRSLGMSKPKSAAMRETEDGFSYLIPCTDVFEPSVEYFIIAEDDDGDQVGNSGTPQHPVVVPIVTARSAPAPALPGQAPPQQCGAVEEECPPGMPGCSSGTGQLGDTCRKSAECSSGLKCVDDFCSMSDGDDEDDDDGGKTGQPRWFLDVGAGVGATYVGEGKTADRSPSVELVTEAQEWVEEDRADAYLFENGYDCDTSMEVPLVASNCKVAVKKPGFVAVPIITFAVGYYVTPKIGLSLTGRFQLQRGEGPMAGMAVGGRFEYQMTKPEAKGFHAGFLAGASVGTIQARPGTESTRKGPYATSAAYSTGVGALAHIGFRIGYRFSRYFGVQAAPQVSLGFPSFLPSLDLSAGLEGAF
jgi:hypothetical protein